MELLVYKASAGSGKTFTLAAEYIKHLIRNPRAYKQILAVTFTNKATAEMKERILTQLYGIWKSDPASEPYLQKVLEGGVMITDEKSGEKRSATVEDARHRAGQALQYMLHDYGRFRVETIDSFFQSVMRNLARELELAPNLNIELNNVEVLSDAVDSLIEKLTPDSPVLAWLLEYINERIADDKRWNVSNEVKQFGRNIFDENYIERGELLRRKLQDPSALKLYKEALREMETEALEQMKGFSEQFEGELEARLLSPDDLKNGSRGIGSYFRKLRDGKLPDKEVKNKTLESCLNDAQSWVTKTHPRRKELLQLVEESLLPLLRQAEKLRPSRLHTLNSCRLSLKHLNKLRLLNHIDEEVRELNHEHNRFLLSDTNALLHGLMREGDSSFVFEKLGAQIRNVMIDEFQDTSRMQWDNFRLLLLEGLSQGADSLIVGDVKQSIYRWRNGDWGILNGLGNDASASLPPSSVRVETLKVNRRSEANIISFNNALFQAAVDYLNTIHLNELNEECLPLKQAYADVVQASPKEIKRGYVQAILLENDKDTDYTRQTLVSLGHEVQRLMAEGVKLNDMAILVRKNKNIPFIADYFNKELSLSVVSDEAFRLDASEAVTLLVEALRVLSNPDDRIALAALEQALSSSSPRLDAFQSRLPELRMMPLYELTETLYRLLELEQIPKQEAYLFAFFDAITEYQQRNSSDIGSFLQHWDEKLCSKTIPGGEVEGIRIYSIHKSKGLEFHTVLIPFCDWKLENETINQLVWCTPPTAPYNALDLVPVSYSPLMADSVYRQAYLNERLQLWVDNLNLLYVALTRAGKNLLMWGKKEQRNTMSELLSHSLPIVAGKLEADWKEESEVAFAYGTITPSAASSQPKEEKVGNRLAEKSVPLPIKMQSRQPEMEFKQSNRSADFIAGVDESHSWRRFINRGQLLHTLFSAIRTEADIDTAISRLLFEGIIENREQEEELRTFTHQAFDHPQVKSWYDGSWQLFNECDIIWLEQGELRNRRPDRVMMRGEDIVVVDFKFGKPEKRYSKQVAGYIHLLRRMGYTKQTIRGYLWYVTEQRVEAVTASSEPQLTTPTGETL